MTGPRDGRMDLVETNRPVLDSVGLAMALISLGVSLSLVGPLVRPGEVGVMVALSLVLIGYRGYLVFRPDAPGVRRIGHWISMLAAAALVFISPVYGAYAFLGYLESARFTGLARYASLLGTALITAAAQMGGPRGFFASWPVYGLMLAINLAIVAFITMLERQRERHVTMLETTVAELRASEARNAALQEQLITQAREAGITDERARLSREIHDTVAQGLVGIITQLEAAQPGADDLEQRLDRARASARDSLAEARRAVRALASPRLDDQGLPSALEELVRQTGEAAGLRARFVLDGEPGPTPADAELLRIAQEGLANVMRHAEAARVVVSLSYGPDEVRLDIRDDGRGFDASRPSSGHGLAGMRQRLARLGGDLEIESTEGEGCAISAAVPR